MKDKIIPGNQVTSLGALIEAEERLHIGFNVRLDIDQEAQMITVKYSPKRIMSRKDVPKAIDDFTKELNVKRLNRFDRQYPEE
jgi:hypothetical protein